MDFLELIEFIEYQSSGNWNYVEREGDNRIRFDWYNGSFWVNSDFTIEGTMPNKVKEELMDLDAPVTFV